ncbi:PAS domain-containing protein [Hymenobacter cellulosivorans]|uniref:histidine kinase n=1 Tax=Hymenobacter cellulosivorans TaxID=2932249 RepID=A0ABY4F512_9BACT|nr:PAS domain-containing protein [Hymenobacter cellulosivorans]UOQ51613.1 PAS domain-containing protein [Hymenobacter cellulosivorans]
MPVAPEAALLFTALPRPFMLFSPDFVIEAVSDAYLQATLSQREQVVGRVVFDAFPDNPLAPEARSTHNLRASLEQVLATKQPHQMAQQHYDVPDPDHPGQFVERHWQVLNTPVLDAQGAVVQIIHMAQDVTAEVQGQARLRESQARERVAQAAAEAQRAELQRVFEQAPIALSRLRGPEFVVEWANARMGQIWGRPLDQIVGRPHFEALPDLAGQGFEAVFAGVLQTGEPYYFRELLVRIEQAHQYYQGYFNITYQPAYDEQGGITGLIASAIEVTDQVRARQQVQDLNQELATSNEELQAANEEYLTANTNLSVTQQRLELLNQQLEARVQERTRQLSEQQQLLRLILGQVPAAIATFSGPEHRYTFFNDAYQTLSGGRARLAQPVAQVLPEVMAQGFVGLLNEVYASGQPFIGTEMPIMLLDAATGQPEPRYLDFILQPLADEHDTSTGILAFIVDVTDKGRARQQAEALQAQLLTAARHQAAERLAFFYIFEQAPVLVALLRDPGHRFEYVNPAYQALFPGRRLVGLTVEEAVPEMLAQGFVALMDHVYQTGETYVGQQMPFLAQPAPGQPPGPVCYYTFTYQAYRENGQVAGISIFAHDVTEQVLIRQKVEGLNQELAAINEELTATNEALLDTNQQLVRSNVDLDNFIYTASHDLKAPISNIEGLLLALEHELPAAGRVGNVDQMLTMMQGAVERFKRTLRHLTEVSRLQQEYKQASAPVELAGVIEAVYLDLQPLVQHTQAQVEVQVPAGLTLLFSEKNLRSVVYNLLSNALKYRAPDRPPRVRIRAWPQADYQVLAIEDNGLGLDLTQRQDKLFAMFQRFHDHVEGTGIGLYMVKKMVENAGGRIEVESQLGQGSTFRVYFLREQQAPGSGQ